MAQRKFLIDGGFSVNNDSDITGNLTMTGHILPSVDSDGTTGYDLGSTTAKWRDLYLSEGSLYINNQKVIEDNSGTIVVRADADQSLTVKTEGTGVLTFQSAQTVNMAATLQMAAGKRITDAGGDAVTFGDKIDLDNNQIINVATPTADGHAANKLYVDSKFDDVLGGAPAALDTLNELANALGDDSNYAATITTALAAKADTTYVDTQISNLQTTVASGAYGDTDVADYLSNNNVTTNIIFASTFAPKAIDQDLRLATSGSKNAKFDLNDGHLDLMNSQIKNIGTPTDTTDAANKAYVDSQVAAGAYSDADVATYLQSGSLGGVNIEGDIEIGNGNTLNLYAKGGTDARIVYKSETNLGLDVDYDLLGSESQFPTLHAYMFKPLDGIANLIFRTGTNGMIDVGNAKIKDVGTPTSGDQAANKAYVDSQISNLETTVAAGAYSDADVNTLLESNLTADRIQLRTNNSYFGVGTASGSAGMAIKNNGGGAFFYGSKYLPKVGTTDLELEANTGGKINVNGYRVYNVGTPTDTTDAANKAYVDSQISSNAYSDTDVRDVLNTTPRFDAGLRLGENADLYLKQTNSGSDITVIENSSGQAQMYAWNYRSARSDGHVTLKPNAGSSVDVDNSKIINVSTPTNTTDAANKAYVDAAEADANTYTDGQIAALDFNNVDGGIAVTGGALSLGTNSDLTLAATSEVAFNGSTIVGVDPDAAGNPAVCASSFRPISGQADLNLSPGTGGNIALSSAGDVTYGGVGIVGDDPDSAGQPAVCASTFRPVSGQTDLNVRAGTGGAVTFGNAVLEGVGTPVAGTDATNKTYVDTYADAAEAAAVSAAAVDATTKADAAEAAAVATAAADATAKANAAEAAANTYTDTAVAGLVDSAPGTLDTLNELAAALGDDANFSTTVTNSIATKLAPSDLTNFHSAVTTVTSTQSATNATGTVAIVFSDLTNAVHYNIYLNRLLLRPSEYTVSGTTVTFTTALLATDDELEITGMHASV